jgi:hypothetical protein
VRARLLAATAALAALGAAPAAADAQLVAIGGAGRLVSSTRVPVQVSGAVAARWDADPATCAAGGRCGMEGVATWTAPPRGFLILFEVAVGERRERGGFLVLADEERGGTLLRSRVRRATADGSRLCTDAVGTAGFISIEERRGRVAVGLRELASGTLLANRCAGPTTADAAAGLPSLRVPFETLARGRTTLRLGGEGGFVAGGLRGRVTSSLTLRLGAPRRETEDVREAGEVLRRSVRELDVRYRVAEVRGEVAVDVRGAAEEVECSPLDACGLAGTLRLLPALRRGTVDMYARAPAARGRRALRAALGLVPAGGAPRASRFGTGSWEGPGRTEVALSREGEPPCIDVAELEKSALGFAFRRDSVRVTYDPIAGRDRCPGPLLGFTAGAASADVPLSAFRSRRVEIALTRPATLLDQGWAASTRPALTVVLERERVRERVIRATG